MGDFVDIEIPLLPSFPHLLGEAGSGCQFIFGLQSELLSQVSSLLESGYLLEGAYDWATGCAYLKIGAETTRSEDTARRGV